MGSRVGCRIGNGAGFLGDNLDAPRLLAERGALDYLTLEYLSELTLSILARVREKNPSGGYAGDLIEVLRSLLPTLREQPRLKLVTNAGGMNPRSCAIAAASTLLKAGLAEDRIGVVTGDDLATDLKRLQSLGCKFEHMDTGEPLDLTRYSVVSANAYLGAKPIADALAEGARHVITGRVADASLTLGPAMHEFGWSWTDWNKLAAATVAGHVIECGAQATGGLYRHWEPLDLGHVGYPIAELGPAGEVEITKPEGTGGAVTRETVIEQLLYEIGDPAHYLTPDVDVDFTTLDVRQTGKDRVSIETASGRPAPSHYKVSLAHRAGYTASGQLLVCGRDCRSKARACGAMILARLKTAGFEFDDSLIECLGAGESAPGFAPQGDVREVMLRVSVRDRRREAVERFTKEIAPLITSGPPGLAGYASGRSSVRPVFAYGPTLVPKELVQPAVEVRSASQWATAVTSASI
ncbi:MAG TPA: acyclic terpene utilization AtuA family protein [Pirellulales bacterium]